MGRTQDFHCQRFGKSCFLLVVECVETQLRKIESCAIIFSSWREDLAPVRESRIHKGCLTMHAPDLG